MANRDHSLYGTWRQMRKRCNCSGVPDYPYYGGRGIQVCKRWDSFSTFVSDMGPRPSGFTLDRIDNNGNYSPENCRWASASQQQRNTRRSIKATFNGNTKHLKEWSSTTGISYETLKTRLARGWSIKRALTAPLKK